MIRTCLCRVGMYQTKAILACDYYLLWFVESRRSASANQYFERVRHIGILFLSVDLAIQCITLQQYINVIVSLERINEL